MFGRRDLLKSIAAYGSASMLGLTHIAGASETGGAPLSLSPRRTNTRLVDVTPNEKSTVTIERRGQVVLIGINRPKNHNRIDPETYDALGKAYFGFEHDPSLRAAVLFGHGEHFSRGIDVDAYELAAKTGKIILSEAGTIDPLGKRKPFLTKPLVAVTHGHTWNMAHELHLVADIRIAAGNTEFGQGENTHGRFPGGGSTVRFVSEVGWGNAMRYMLTGDHWDALEAYRMGEIQAIATTREEALALGIGFATKIAMCAPLGIQATLASAHLAIDPQRQPVFDQLTTQYRSLYRTEDFREGRSAEAEHRAPVYIGQ